MDKFYGLSIDENGFYTIIGETEVCRLLIEERAYV